MKHFALLLAFISFTQLALATKVAEAPGEKTILQTDGGEVRFLAIGRPNAIKIKGTGQSPKGKLELSKNILSGKFEFELENLSTGLSLRDKHMKEKYLQTKDHPKAALEITNLQVPESIVKGPKGKSEKVPFTGKLQLHGEEKEVSGIADVKIPDDQQAVVEAELEIKLADYKISTPEFAGVKVADNVQISVSTKLKVTK